MPNPFCRKKVARGIGKSKEVNSCTIPVFLFLPLPLITSPMLVLCGSGINNNIKLSNHLVTMTIKPHFD